MTTFRDEILSWPDDWRERWEERSAIMEFDGGLRPAKADWQAYLDVKKEMEARDAA